MASIGRAATSNRAKSQTSVIVSEGTGISDNERVVLEKKLSSLRFETEFLLEPGARRISARYVSVTGKGNPYVLLRRAKLRPETRVSIRVVNGRAYVRQAKGDPRYKIEGLPFGISRPELRSSSYDVQIAILQAWFSQNFVEGAPEGVPGRIDGSQGWENLPALDHLRNEFANIVSSEIIEKAASGFPSTKCPDELIETRDFIEFNRTRLASERRNRRRQRLAILEERLTSARRSLAEVELAFSQLGHNSNEVSPPLSRSDVSSVVKRLDDIERRMPAIKRGNIPHEERRRLTDRLYNASNKLSSWLAARLKNAAEKSVDAMLLGGISAIVYCLRDDLLQIAHAIYNLL